MTRRFKRWLSRHASFNTYLKVAMFLDPIEQKLDLAKYALFTRTKEGSCLQGTVNPKVHRVIDNAICGSFLPAVILIATLIIPSYLPQSISSVVMMQLESSVISGFMTAILAVAGIFLTLFYTNANTVFSNKYPSSYGDIPKLFVSLATSDKNLKYCTSFVVVASLSFVLCALQRFNWLAFAYVFALTLTLIGKLPNVFALSTEKTDISAVVAVPANRFLVLARAASFDRSFFDSDYLVLNFKKIGRNDLAMMDNLMDYSLSAGDYAPSYSKAVNDIVLETLVKYSQISSIISAESLWHAETSSHKPWFTSSTYELNLAISTGAIPLPSKTIDPFGYHKELHRISSKYGKHLIESKATIEYSNYFALSTLVLEYSIKHGDIGWAKEYSGLMLDQCLDYCLSIDGSNKDDLQMKLHLLEQYAVMLTTIPLALTKLCTSVPSSAFHFDSFQCFSQAELQGQGFPLGINTQMRIICKKLEHEKEAFDILETPKWWFDNNVNRFASDEIERLCSWVLLLHDGFCSTIKKLTESDPKASYILTLQEAELYNKSENCIRDLLELARTHFDTGTLGKDYLLELENIHNDLVRTFPELAKSFMKDDKKLEEIFPDLYGFAFFNYCQLAFRDIIDGRLDSFCASIIPLYHLVVISSIDLQKTVAEGTYNDIYKAQILFEPTVFFLELCGMAYAMAELAEESECQTIISSRIASIIEDNPRERTRWSICVNLSDDFTLNGKIDMDLFSWRMSFLDTVKESERYPDVPQLPFRITEWELPAGRERLLEMLPPDSFSLHEFSGCKVFKNYLLGDENNE